MINSRFREIEVQIAKNQAEITFNIFRKLTATRTFRNVFVAIVTVTQVAGIILVFVAWNGFTNKYTPQTKTDWSVYGSYTVSISIWLMLLGYLAGFIIQYRSMMRLIQFLTDNPYLRWTIFIYSLFLMLIYFCALAQSLFYFWGVAAIK